MKNTSKQSVEDRIAGSIVGAFIGDALGLGVHWYYDLEELHRDYGDWIDSYNDAKTGRYHEGCKAGDSSQTGFTMKLLLHSIAATGEYNEADFTRRLDEELFTLVDGTAESGPAGYSNQAVREVYKKRVTEGKAWGDAGDHADTSEAAERISILAARYALHPEKAVTLAAQNCRLMQIDGVIVAHTTVFGGVISALIRGQAVDEALSQEWPSIKDIPVSDAAKTASDAVALALNHETRIEPAWSVAKKYGMACAATSLLPAAYDLAARFPDDFEQAVLNAINGGGENMSRGCLTGALSGAQVGLSGIPERFVTGLSVGDEITTLAQTVAKHATASIG